MQGAQASGIPFGEYRLLRRLGAGGMAEVFLAKRLGPKGFEKQLVIKRILPHLSASERFTALFLEEARIAALLDHPNLVHVSSFGEIDGNYYLAMEYVDGVTVAELLELSGTLTPGVASRIAIDLLGALSAIHAAKNERGEPMGLVHRDVSPRNVMISRDGTVKLLDFGIAVSRAQGEVALMGTRRYMSPEHLRGEKLDARADLFCVGLLLYEMIAGDAPFAGEPEQSPKRPEVCPEALWSTVAQTLALLPSDRPVSARSLQAALELFVASRGIEGTRAHLADVIAALIPEHRAPARGLSRVTQQTMTRILRRTAPLVSGELEPEPPAPVEARASATGDALVEELEAPRPPVMRVVVMMAVAMVLGGVSVLVVHRLGAMSGAREAPREVIVQARPQPEIARAASTTVAVAREERHVEEPRPAAVEERRAEERAEAEKAVVKKAPAGPGTLTIDTRPWTEVYLAGKKLGLTPMEGVKLPSGKHELELRNPSLGIVRRIQVTIRPGKVTRVQRDL